MKKIIFFSLIMIWGYSNSQGQLISSIDTGKYRINLPDFWSRGNKIWQILNDKLPLVCEELKDKDLCGDDCNPSYSIEFEMSEPVIFDSRPNHISSDFTNNLYKRPSEVWDLVTYYGFECSLLLLNEKNELLTRLILVDTNELWTVTNRITLASYASPPTLINSMRRPTTSRSGQSDLNYIPTVAMLPSIGQQGVTPFEYINTHKACLSPNRRDMLTVVDKKIRAL